MTKLRIDVGLQGNGYAFRLYPLAARWLEQNFPDAPRVNSLFIGYDGKHTITTLKDANWYNIINLLTGLTPSQLEDVENITVVAPRTGETVYKVSPQHVEVL